jgi:endonuclease III
MAHKLSIRKTKRLRQILAKSYRLPEAPEHKDSLVDQVVMTVLWADAAPAKARQAYAKLQEVFVDWNELRVSVTAEAGAVLEACGLAPVKAIALKRILTKVVEEYYTFDFESLAKLSREDLKAWFMGIEGMPHYVAAGVLYQVFDYDRVLVDADIARVVRRLGLVSEGATEAEIEAGLAQVIPGREAHFIYSALRQHALSVCKKEGFDCRTCPLRKECKAAPGRIAELEAAARAAKRKPKPKPKARARKAKPKLKPKAPARRPAKKP